MLLLATLTASAQRLTAERTTIDVGRTGYQQPITAVFEFRKRGTRKVRIEKVVPDCNCTVVEYPKGDVGDKFQIRMCLCLDAVQTLAHVFLYIAARN